jgi:hypothetical protein
MRYVPMVEEKEYKIGDILPAGEFVIEFRDAGDAPLPDIEVKITVDSSGDFSGTTRSDGTFRTAKPQSVFDVSLISGTPATGSSATAQTASARAGPENKKTTAVSREGVEPPVSVA